MKRKSIPALLLAASMILGLLGGCGDAQSASESQPASQEEVAAATEAPAEVTEEAAQEASVQETVSVVEEEVVLGPEAYYACEETTEITMLFQYAAFFQGFFPEGWQSSNWWTAFGEKTNTTWSLREVSNLEWQENVNLLCASGDLPDTVCNIGSVYSGGIAAAIRDEQILDFADLVEEYAPHYVEQLTADEYTLKTALTDDGEMGAMFPLLKDPFPVTSGLWIRQDWLDELGMDIPTDTDSLYEALKAFKENFGADVGFFQQLRPNTNQAGVEAEGIWNAFGRANFYLDEDGAIQYGPMQDYFYEYIGFLKQLAEEGLFLTSDMTDQKAADLFASGSIGLEGDSPDNLTSYLALLDEAEAAKCNLVPMAALGEATEYSPKITYVSTDAGGNVSISNNCQNPEVVLKAFDYLFTDEGYLLSSYGIEGETLAFNDAGEPELTDLMLSNPDGIPTRAAFGYFANPGVPGLMNYARGQTVWNDVQKSAIEIWSSAYTGDSGTVDVDALSLTEEERDEISVYLSDMITFANEWINGVIFGDTQLTDETIAQFQDSMENTMHITQILDTYNTAYERFQERSFGA